MTGRILHFVARWLPVSEGFVYDLVCHLGHSGVVVASRPLENLDRFALADVHSLAGLRRVVPRRFEQKALTVQLLSMAARRHVALVHVHHGYDADVVAGLVRRKRVPLVVSLHGDDVTGLVARHPRAYARVAPLTSAVVVPSAFLADFAVAAGFDPALVRILPSGIDTGFFAPTPLPDGRPEVLFVGRFVEKKGLDVLAEAWPKVAATVPDARLRLLGLGELEPLARAIGGEVEVVIGPTRGQVRDAMRRARVVVSPSRTATGDAVESLVVVNLEAQCSGRPVVTTDHGGIPEHVRPGETALVVREGDPAALADALVEVLTDDALAVRLGEAGPRWAARYDIRRTAGRMDELYDALIGGSLRGALAS